MILKYFTKIPKLLGAFSNEPDMGEDDGNDNADAHDVSVCVL